MSHPSIRYNSQPTSCSTLIILEIRLDKLLSLLQALHPESRVTQDTRPGKLFWWTYKTLKQRAILEGRTSVCHSLVHLLKEYLWLDAPQSVRKKVIVSPLTPTSPLPPNNILPSDPEARGRSTVGGSDTSPSPSFSDASDEGSTVTATTQAQKTTPSNASSSSPLKNTRGSPIASSEPTHAKAKGATRTQKRRVRQYLQAPTSPLRVAPEQYTTSYFRLPLFEVPKNTHHHKFDVESSKNWTRCLIQDYKERGYDREVYTRGQAERLIDGFIKDHSRKQARREPPKRVRKRPIAKFVVDAHDGKNSSRARGTGKGVDSSGVKEGMEGMGLSTPVRVLSETFGETPQGLRDLERGWREKRRAVLGDSEVVNTLGPKYPREDARKKMFDGRQGVEVELSGRLPLGQTPLPTPPNSPKMEKPSRWISVEEEIDSCPPIMVGALPLTHGPVRLTSRSKSTIHVIPSPAPHSIILEMEDGSTVKIRRDGRVLVMQSHTQGRRRLTSSIRLDDEIGWKKDEREIWEGIAKLVEGYKRATPKVKIWHALGVLTVSCSDPPDITLTYEQPIAGGLETHMTRVRLVYSPSRGLFCIDTAGSIKMTGGVTEKSRCRRKVQMKREDSTRLNFDTSHWTEGEVDALKRFEGLRSEWQRHIR